MKSNHWRKTNDGGAFTVVELLVVLAIVVVLASLALPGLTRAQAQSRQAQCASNLRQLTLANLTYAGENADRLPAGVGGGAWVWDISPAATGLLGTYGAGRQQFYCPANPDQNEDGLWNFAVAANPPYRVVGYVLTFSGNSTLVASNANTLATPQQVVIGSVFLSPPPTAKRVLAADVTISQSGQNNTANKLTYSYKGVPGAFPTPHRTSHMDLADRFPAGGNVGMLDGHVEWTSFSNVISRTSSGPGFWW